MPSTIGKLTDPANLALLGGTALGGLFPQVGSTSGTSTSNSGTQTTASSNNYSASDINSLIQTLSELTSRNQTTGTATSTPSLSPEASKFMNNLIGRYTNLAGSTPNLAPYLAQQTQGINRNSQLQSQAVDNIMAARGLSTSPAAGTAQANIQANRVGQINNAAQQIPLLQHQLNLQNLGAAGGFFSALPKGLSTTNNQVTEGSQIGNTSQLGKTTGVQTSDTNAQTNSASQGTTVQSQQTKEGGGIGGFFQSILPILAKILIP